MNANGIKCVPVHVSCVCLFVCQVFYIRKIEMCGMGRTREPDSCLVVPMPNQIKSFSVLFIYLFIYLVVVLFCLVLIRSAFSDEGKMETILRY